MVSNGMRALIGEEMARVSAQTAVGEAAEIIVQAKAEIQHHIYGPRDDSTYRVEFRTSETLAISVPRH
jgi:hypothetical protein